MKLSDLKFGQSVHDEDLIQTATDSWIVVKRQADIDRAIAQMGDIEIGLHADEWGRVRVYTPSLNEQREAYEAAKMAACNRWGCE